jgi:hypothetical protein
LGNLVHNDIGAGEAVNWQKMATLHGGVQAIPFTPTSAILVATAMPYRSFLLFACVALLVAPLAFAGGRMLYRANLIQSEQFDPAVPLDGPYSEQELQTAKGRLAGVMPPDEFLKGVTREQLESAAEAARAIERARKESWEDRRPKRLAHAAQRRRTGWLLLGLAVLLLAAWGCIAWSARTPGTASGT